MFVSSAAGAVGAVAGQIAKIQVSSEECLSYIKPNMSRFAQNCNLLVYVHFTQQILYCLYKTLRHYVVNMKARVVGIVYLCKYFPRLRAFSLMHANYRIYARASRHSRGVVASACAFLAYTGAHQVENNYKDELYNKICIYTFPLPGSW